MPYGTVKVDNITFDNGGADQNVTVSGIHRAITSGVTVTGTISGAVLIGTTTVSGATVTGTIVQGTTVQGVSGTFTSLTGTTTTGTTANFVSGVFTTRVSGTTITGDTGQFTSGTFVSLTGTTITGTTVNAVTVSSTTGTFGSITGTTITGTTINGATVNATTGNFTSLTGVTVTGTTAQFVSGVFTTQVSGLTVTGTQSSFTSGNFITLSGATATFTSGVIASGTEAAPSLSILGDPNTGIYSPGADQVAVATNGTGRLFVDASGNVAIIQSPITIPSYTKIFNVSAQDASIALRANSAGTYTEQGIFFAVDGTNYSQIYNDGIGQLIFRTGSGLSERLRITSAGLVGIGTSTPQTGILDLTRNGTAGTISTYRQLRIGLDANPNYSAFISYGASVAGQSTGLILESLDNGVPSKTIINPSGGNVGIGTTSPSTLLHAAGAVRIGANDTSDAVLEIGAGATGSRNAFIDLTGDTTYDDFGLRIQRENGGANTDSSLAHRGTGSLRLEAVDAGNVAFKIQGSERARIDSIGRLLVGTSSDSGGALFQVNGDRIRIGTAKTPASASATGTTGEIAWDADYIYVCTATNTWKRVAIATW